MVFFKSWISYSHGFIFNTGFKGCDRKIIYTPRRRISVHCCFPCPHNRYETLVLSWLLDCETENRYIALPYLHCNEKKFTPPHPSAPLWAVGWGVNQKANTLCIGCKFWEITFSNPLCLRILLSILSLYLLNKGWLSQDFWLCPVEEAVIGIRIHFSI